MIDSIISKDFRFSLREVDGLRRLVTDEFDEEGNITGPRPDAEIGEHRKQLEGTRFFDIMLVDERAPLDDNPELFAAKQIRFQSSLFHIDNPAEKLVCLHEVFRMQAKVLINYLQ